MWGEPVDLYGSNNLKSPTPSWRFHVAAVMFENRRERDPGSAVSADAWCLCVQGGASWPPCTA